MLPEILRWLVFLLIKFGKNLGYNGSKNKSYFEYCEPLKFPIANCSGPVNIQLPIGIDQSFDTGTQVHYFPILSAAFVFQKHGFVLRSFELVCQLIVSVLVQCRFFYLTFFSYPRWCLEVLKAHYSIQF